MPPITNSKIQATNYMMQNLQSRAPIPGHVVRSVGTSNISDSLGPSFRTGSSTRQSIQHFLIVLPLPGECFVFWDDLVVICLSNLMLSVCGFHEFTRTKYILLFYFDLTGTAWRFDKLRKTIWICSCVSHGVVYSIHISPIRRTVLPTRNVVRSQGAPFLHSAESKENLYHTDLLQNLLPTHCTLTGGTLLTDSRMNYQK